MSVDTKEFIERVEIVDRTLAKNVAGLLCDMQRLPVGTLQHLHERSGEDQVLLHHRVCCAQEWKTEQLPKEEQEKIERIISCYKASEQFNSTLAIRLWRCGILNLYSQKAMYVLIDRLRVKHGKRAILLTPREMIKYGLREFFETVAKLLTQSPKEYYKVNRKLQNYIDEKVVLHAMGHTLERLEIAPDDKLVDLYNED